MLRLSCVSQSYEWGVHGLSSAVGRLAQLGGDPILEAQPYAEFWMGTHPSGPSRVLAPEGTRSSLLHDWLLAHPDALGTAARASAASALPFLFKVLSVGKALSVQAHPDRALAARLHAARPDLYKDANHKPEMALALTRFEAMCAFRAPQDMARWVSATPELELLVGLPLCQELFAAAAEGAVQNFQPVLKRWYAALMTAPADALARATQALAQRLALAAPAQAPSQHSSLLNADAVAARLLKEYPGDVGVFSPYVLNCLALEPGQALFLGANEPHAYLRGDCVEIMAASDNVVRAGLTSKVKDTDTLCSMLTYSTGLPALVEPMRAQDCVLDFCVPVPDFKLEKILAPAGHVVSLPAPPSAAILLAYAGEAAAAVSGTRDVISPGQVWLQPAGTLLELSASSDITYFRACASSFEP
jgi:mannose-6-phosphate isomerase